MKLKIHEIIVEDRARKNMGDMERLKTSIKERGLINPICVTKNGRLLAGGRRLQAHKELGIEEIEVRIYEELDDIDKNIIELEENIHEKFEWEEEVQLIYKIHLLFQQKHGKAVQHSATKGWSYEDTANYLGISKSWAISSVKLAQTIETVPELLNFKSKKQALKQISKLEEMAILQRLNEIQTKNQNSESFPYKTILGKAEEYIKQIPDNSINLVIFDPPWGIGADIIASSRGPGGEKVNYRDSAKVALALRDALLPELLRIMADGSHMYYFTGAQFFWENCQMLEKIGFDYIRQTPLVWIKESGAFTDMDYYFMPSTEQIIFCSKGIRRLNFTADDALHYNRPLSTERHHTAQKPVDLMKFFINISTIAGDTILDPCAGSFVSCYAATLLNRKSIGIEENEENFLKGTNWLKGIAIDDTQKE